MTLNHVFAAAESEGARFWPAGGSVHYRAPAPLSDRLRQLVAENRPALLVALAAWDGAEAVRLMHAADGAVAAAGADGRDPAARVLATGAVAAQQAGSMARVRETCARLEEWARTHGRAA